MPKLTCQAPYFEVFDMNEAIGFYRDLLGYKVIFASPEVETNEGRFSHHVRLRRDDAVLLLNTMYDSNERPPARDMSLSASGGRLQLYIDCDA
jgi:glyoxylase I family protein